jgi:adenylate cyclase
MTIKKILVTDDEGMITRLCRKSLSGEGYFVSTADRGEEALEIASSERFDMLVTDMLMPGMNGLETFMAVREKHHEIIGVLISGHGTMDMAIEAMGHGFSGFIRKPFTSRELIQVVNDSFQKAALKEENTRLRTLIPLFSLGEKFIASQSEKEIFNELIEALFRQTGSQRISIMIYDEKEGCLRVKAARGMKEDMIPDIRIMPGEMVAGKVFEKGEPLILNGGPEENPEFAGLLRSRDIVAAISFPLKAKDRKLGVLNISKIGKGVPFSSSDIEMLSIICGQAVMALENLRIMEEKTEKIRMRTILEQYVSPEVADILISHGQDLMGVGGINRITVLFADIRDFTPLVENLPLETLRAFLNEFFHLLSEIIFKFNGTLDKFMGDALLAFFGEPIHIKSPANSAVSSAVMMHKKFQELKEKWVVENGAIAQIGLGVGISSGEMFLGNVGSQKRFDFTVLGVDVNIAQRLATEAASGEILVTQGVKNEMSPDFRVKNESSRLLKGIKEPMLVYSIVGQ